MYYKKKLPKKDEALKLQIQQVMEKNPGYGYRRVAIALGINTKRAARVMRKYKLKPARRAKTPKKPNDINQPKSSYPDILAKTSSITPDFIWVSDFTYISYKGGWYYLATVLDYYSGVALGFNISKTHDAGFVKIAIERAIEKAGGCPDFFHSDQGSEYNSEIIADWLKAQGVSISMSPKSSPWRNGSQESFYGRFKVEFGDPERFETAGELIESLYQQLHYFVNGRIKNKLKMPPQKFRDKYFSLHDTSTSLSTSYESPPARCFAPLPPPAPVRAAFVATVL